jgi:PAT family beta-lactamase induction signal transducer AmpG
LSRWADPAVVKAVCNRRTLACIFTGFASGMPLYVLVQLIPAWLRDAQVSLVEIGLFSLVGLPYTWKFLWAPFLDRLALPLGLRRGWMLSTQLALLTCIGLLGHFDPSESLQWIVFLATSIAFLSATQDIAIDAFRRELLPDAELGLGNAVHVQAYRIASLVPGSLSLVLADQMPWRAVFWITATFMMIGVAMSLSVKEPQRQVIVGAGFRNTVLMPFREYLARRGWRDSAIVLCFMVAYKIGDNMATALSTPFYLDLGFSKTQIGLIAKHAALWPAIFGGLVGGLIMIRMGINRALWVFGLIQMLSILGFSLLALAGSNACVLATVIAFEYLGVGLGTAALTAFIARESSKTFAATQFALFTALAALPRSLANASTGWFVEAMGWPLFFIFCTLLAVPGLFMLIWVAPWHGETECVQ